MFEHEDLIPNIIEKKKMNIVLGVTDLPKLTSNFEITDIKSSKNEDEILIINIKENERKRSGQPGYSRGNRQLF